jgi:excisionase family DNA binding protein
MAYNREDDDANWISLAELSKRINIPQRTLRTWASEGFLPAEKRGRNYFCYLPDVKKFLLEHYVPAKKTERET